MSLAAATTSFPLLNIFWTMFVFFLWVGWIGLLFFVISDIFRSRDLSGGAKAVWVLFVFLIPLIGLLAYLIARGGEMHDRADQRPLGKNETVRGYTPGASEPPATTADQLQKLADVRDRGAISADEFEREKAKILAT
jgi:Phospholipase_D-nuclease N-terminal/Short C-terminal domain